MFILYMVLLCVLNPLTNFVSELRPPTRSIHFWQGCEDSVVWVSGPHKTVLYHVLFDVCGSLVI